jgi:hypothetical protein
MFTTETIAHPRGAHLVDAVAVLKMEAPAVV